MIETGFAEFVWIWNRRQAQATPRLHLRIARWLAVRWQAGERELLLLAFRSSGKSTLVGLFCAWLLSQNPDLRILVLAGDFALAKKMVRNVKRIIERHPLTANLKPAHTDHWASDQFTVKRRAELRDPSMLAKGIGANITGLRADVVICDDVEVPNTCDTPPKRADLRARLRELEYVVVPGGLQVFVGTPHTYYSIYADQPRPEIGEAHAALAGFHRLEVPLLDEQGRCRWPERFTPARIEAIRRRTGPAKFDSQMMLRPRSIVEGRLDPDRLRLYDTEPHYTEGNREARADARGSAAGVRFLLVGSVLRIAGKGRRQRCRRRIHRRSGQLLAASHAISAARSAAGGCCRRSDAALPPGGGFRPRSASAGDLPGNQRYRPLSSRTAAPGTASARRHLRRHRKIIEPSQGPPDRRCVRCGSSGRPPRRASQHLEHALRRGDARVAARRARAR